MLLVLTFVLERPEVEFLDFSTSPGCFAQEIKARLNARVAVEAIDADALSQTLPAIGHLEVRYDGF